MQLDLTADQVLFHETTLRFVETQLPLPRTRELHDDPTGYDRAWLARTAELGWFTMLVPDDLGGGSVSGDGLLDAALVADVVGRHVQPGPFVPMNVVAWALAAHASPRLQSEVLPGIVAGEIVATWAFADERGAADDGAGVTVTRTGDGLRVLGSRGFVQDAPSADQILVTGTLDGAPVQVLVPTDAEGVTVRALVGLDLGRRFAHVTFDEVTVAADALVDGGMVALEAQLRIAVVLNLAETVGAMDALFAMTVEYAKDRVAFGRPIGSFQAIKHVLADQALYLETSKAGAVAAAKAVARDDDGAGEIVHMVAAYVGDQGHELAQECLQVHGGIGFTWEHDLHLLMRRIQSNGALYGEPTWHRERVCARYGLGEAVPA
ncbi:MAG: acyl-CoA dehydrogenase [Acidimicrobiia bacterium]